MPGITKKTLRDSHEYAALTNISYFVDEEDGLQKNLKSFHENYGDDWKILMTSLEIDSEEIFPYAYKAVVFINENTKELLIATAGIDIKNRYDLFDVVLIHFAYTPNKFSFMQLFINKLEEKIDVSKYTFNTTGHSLGAIMSDLAAIELEIRGHDIESSITFENLGSRKIIDSALERFYPERKYTYNDFEGKIKFYIFNARESLLNTINAQISVPEIVEAKNKSSAERDISSDGSYYIVEKIKNITKFVSWISGITRFLEATTSLLKAIEDHKLVNFLAPEIINTKEVDDCNITDYSEIDYPETDCPEIDCSKNDSQVDMQMSLIAEVRIFSDSHEL